MPRLAVTRQNLIAPQTCAAPLVVGDALHRLGALIGVIDTTTTSLPLPSYYPGQSYLILSASPTGFLTGLTNHIVYWTGGHWDVIPPASGLVTQDFTSGKTLAYISGAWHVIKGSAYLGTTTTNTTIECRSGTVQEYNIAGTTTLLYPNSLREGAIYTVVIRNTSGSSRTLNLGSGGWAAATSSWSVPNNQMACLSFTKDPTASRALLLNGEIRLYQA